MVGEGERGHAEGNGAVHEPVDPAGTVEQAVVGMDVKMDEILVGRRHGLANEGEGRKRARRKEFFARSSQTPEKAGAI